MADLYKDILMNLIPMNGLIYEDLSGFRSLYTSINNERLGMEVNGPMVCKRRVIRRFAENVFVI